MPRVCPECEYDLSGHPAGEAVCPECGLLAREDPAPKVLARGRIAQAAAPTMIAGACYIAASLIWRRGSSDAPAVPWLAQLASAALSPLLVLAWATAIAQRTQPLTVWVAGRILLGGCAVNLLVVILTIALIVLLH